MKATEFCHFFEFSLREIEDSDKTDEEYTEGDKYIITDDQGVFSSRFVSDVSSLAGCFDSMLDDTLADYVEEFGFKSDDKSGLTYYEQVKEWIEKDCYYLYNTDTYDVICCLIDPSLIEDDVKEQEKDIVDDDRSTL